jgi:hypothetical protein
MFCATEAAVISQDTGRQTPVLHFSGTFQVAVQGNGLCVSVCMSEGCRQSFVWLTLCELRKDPRENNKYQPVFKFYTGLLQRKSFRILFFLWKRVFLLTPISQKETIYNLPGREVANLKSEKIVKHNTAKSHSLDLFNFLCVY